MEREILFRGKRLDNGEWKIGSLLAWNNGRYYISIAGLLYEVDPETVGQYTGREDKNSNKIYEDDVLKCEYEAEVGFTGGEWKTISFTGVVEFDKARCTYMVRASNGMLLPVFDQMDSLEKIGNIHDNPELMGEQSGNTGELGDEETV